MSQTQYSHSRVSTYESCPRQYQFRYIDGVRTVQAPEADDDGIVGNALHTGAEKDEKAMLEWYFNQFYVIDDNQVNESIKLITLLPKVKQFLATLDGEFRHEYEINRPDYKGFIDLIVTNSDGTVDIYDFKYSNNVDKYLKSPQPHLYKFYLEREGFKVNRIGFVFIPKIRTHGKYAKIKQRNGEDLYQFRKRIKEAVCKSEIRVEYIDYDFQQVKQFWQSIGNIEAATHYPKNPTFLCDWCDYKNYCLQGDDTMILPSTDRREIGAVKRKTLWIYGAPFSGKTWFTNKFKKPLMLNTDGNIDFVDAPFIPIRDEVTIEGRITNRKLAWVVFKETISELEKKQNDFGTIIVDLLEDCYEHCRVFIYDKHSIEHESDNSFKYYDVVKTEFLSTMRRLLNLPYDIILISHEDLSKDFTKKTGDKVTRIAPNIQEKTANKIAGMVQIVARVVSDDDERWLTFKTSEVEFGGGRLGVRGRKIPLEYEEFVKLYDEVNAGKSEAPKRGRQSKKETVKDDPQPKVSEGNGKPVDLEADIEARAEDEVEAAEPEKPRRRRSKPAEDTAPPMEKSITVPVGDPDDGVTLTSSSTPPWEPDPESTVGDGKPPEQEQPRTRRSRRAS